MTMPFSHSGSLVFEALGMSVMQYAHLLGQSCSKICKALAFLADPPPEHHVSSAIVVSYAVHKQAVQMVMGVLHLDDGVSRKELR